MFLRSLALLASLAFTVPVLAGKKLPVELGRYEVTKGPADKCISFDLKELPEKDEEPVYVSPLHSFIAKNQKIKMKSEPQCSFTEQAKRKDKKAETIVTMVTTEECEGKVKGVSTHTFNLKSGSIILKVEVKDADGYTCEWALASAKKADSKK